jgi:RNA polymerase sigma factor (sigma-70 family)
MITSNATQVAAQTPVSFNISEAIEEHLPLVKKLANIYYHRYGRNFEKDDLEGYGNLGLVWACQKYAGMEYSMRQAIDFPTFVEKRIIRNISTGMHRMARIHRDHWRAMKKGKIPTIRFTHDSDEYTLADAIAGTEDNPYEAAEANDYDSKVAWLHTINPIWAKIVHLHFGKSKTFPEIGRIMGKRADNVSSICSKGVNRLRWKFAPELWHNDAVAHKQRRHRRILGMMRASA